MHEIGTHDGTVGSLARLVPCNMTHVMFQVLVPTLQDASKMIGFQGQAADTLEAMAIDSTPGTGVLEYIRGFVQVSVSSFMPGMRTVQTSTTRISSLSK